MRGIPNFPAMRYPPVLVLVAMLLVAAGCAKEEPLITATLQASCRGCVVSYAAGAAQSKSDTLIGVVDPSTGDTLAEEGTWTLHLKDGDNLFFRACRMQEDTAYGDIQLRVSGGVRPMEATVDTTQACAEINQAAYAP